MESVSAVRSQSEAHLNHFLALISYILWLCSCLFVKHYKVRPNGARFSTFETNRTHLKIIHEVFLIVKNKSKAVYFGLFLCLCFSLWAWAEWCLWKAILDLRSHSLRLRVAERRPCPVIARRSVRIASLAVGKASRNQFRAKEGEPRERERQKEKMIAEGRTELCSRNCSIWSPGPRRTLEFVWCWCWRMPERLVTGVLVFPVQEAICLFCELLLRSERVKIRICSLMPHSLFDFKNKLSGK